MSELKQENLEKDFKLQEIERDLKAKDNLLKTKENEGTSLQERWSGWITRMEIYINVWAKSVGNDTGYKKYMALCDQTCRCQYKFDVKSKRAAIKWRIVYFAKWTFDRISQVLFFYFVILLYFVLKVNSSKFKSFHEPKCVQVTLDILTNDN